MKICLCSLCGVQIQKEATPVPGRCQSEAESIRIFETLAPNAVVCERSAEDGVDVVAQRVAAFQDIGARLEKGQTGVAKEPGAQTKQETQQKLQLVQETLWWTNLNLGTTV